jgi:hypothetical protein
LLIKGVEPISNNAAKCFSLYRAEISFRMWNQQGFPDMPVVPNPSEQITGPGVPVIDFENVTVLTVFIFMLLPEMSDLDAGCLDACSQQPGNQVPPPASVNATQQLAPQSYGYPPLSPHVSGYLRAGRLPAAGFLT